MDAAAHRSEPAARMNEPPPHSGCGAGGGARPDTRSLDRLVLSLRGPRNPVRSDRAYAALVEEEMSAAGELTPVATVFLTNRECPFRCLMCDLWKNTLQYTVPAGAIPGQIERALADLPTARQIKLYNSGSFFDPKAIPPSDYPAIARLLEPFEHTIVECHPAFVGPRVFDFRQRLSSTLEVAIGLETAHPDVLAKLNKRMTGESFARAVGSLTAQGVAVRVFILLRPPFLSEAEGLEWAIRSIDFAFDCGASVCSVIPTRRGSGALEWLEERGEFQPPTLSSLEKALEYGVSTGRGRVFADLWDLGQFKGCDACFPLQVARMESMNRSQRVVPPVRCDACELSGIRP